MFGWSYRLQCGKGVCQRRGVEAASVRGSIAWRRLALAPVVMSLIKIMEIVGSVAPVLDETVFGWSSWGDWGTAPQTKSKPVQNHTQTRKSPCPVVPCHKGRQDKDFFWFRLHGFVLCVSFSGSSCVTRITSRGHHTSTSGVESGHHNPGHAHRAKRDGKNIDRGVRFGSDDFRVERAEEGQR